MSINFSNGFLFAIGWFVAKVAIHFAVSFINELLYRLWPWYKAFMDEQDRKKHPWRYISRED